jgi:hypothetical protein
MTDAEIMEDALGYERPHTLYLSASVKYKGKVRNWGGAISFDPNTMEVAQIEGAIMWPLKDIQKSMALDATPDLKASIKRQKNLLSDIENNVWYAKRAITTNANRQPDPETIENLKNLMAELIKSYGQ